MPSDQGQKETPDPGTVAKDGRRAPGVHTGLATHHAQSFKAQSFSRSLTETRGGFLPNWAIPGRKRAIFQLDPSQFQVKFALSIPAGPLSQDMLSLGGFSFAGGASS
jgi:hypothetical protein